MKKIKVFQLLGMIILAQVVYGQTNKRFIVIVRGFKQLTGNCYYKSNTVAYKYAIGYGNNQSLKETISNLKNTFVSRYGIRSSDVMNVTNWSSDYPVACIIKYIKDKGKECETQHFAIRFGKDAASAKSNAITEMRLYYNGDDYSVDDIITYANTEK